MSDHKPKIPIGTKAPKAYGWMAEYSDEHQLLEAARKVRDSGYTATDAFTPFPVHGIDHALGIKPTVLPFIVLCCGATGLCLALLMQWWMNAIDYPYIISGKPLGITPASIPVTFEMTILFSAFSSFLGMIALNSLPRFSNPVFTNPRFDRATDDKFFLYVSASDKYYNRESVKELLGGTSPDALDEVMDDESPAELPKAVWLGALLLVLTGLIPLMIVFNIRESFSDKPRFHVFLDMDFQPKKKAQQQTTIFADGRTMRPQVVGTVGRGQLEEQDAFYLGYDPDTLAATPKSVATRLVSLQDGDAGSQEGATTQEALPAGDAPANDSSMAAQPPAVDAPEKPWIADLPIEITEANMKLGEQKFQIYCATCHGYAGFGDGLVHKRADALAQGTWLPPTSMHIDRVKEQPVGKIFNTISKGQGKMAGYANAITPKERWAIVLYIRALQRSQDAKLDDIPVDKRSSLDEAGSN
ncbi:quinol:electron acceptor oxidoreductase subunit ActD [Pirellulaceae bacterium SH449]